MCPIQSDTRSPEPLEVPWRLSFASPWRRFTAALWGWCLGWRRWTRTCMAVVLVIHVIYSNRSPVTERIRKTQCVPSSFHRNSDIIHQYTSGNSRGDRHMKSIYVLYTIYDICCCWFWGAENNHRNKHEEAHTQSTTNLFASLLKMHLYDAY